MNTAAILSEIDSQIERLQQARALLLQGAQPSPTHGLGHPQKATQIASAKRVLSPEARARIAAAQKKRWAERRKGRSRAV